MRQVPSRSTDFYQSPVFHHNDITSFLAADISSGIHTIWGMKYPIDFHISVKKGTPILFFLNGAIPRSRFATLPVFHGLRMMEGLNATTVSLSDPTLYADKDLGLAWFGGTRDFPLQNVLPLIIDGLVEATNASTVIFCGPSGGGFASLSLALSYRKSLALVWNPQTDILQYHRGLVSQFTNTCYGLNYPQACESIASNFTTNLSAAYRQRYSGNTVLYLQNLSDGHVKRHAEPFLQSLCGRIRLSQKRGQNMLVAGGLWYFSSNWGQGHVAPAGKIIRQILRLMVQHHRQWPKLTRTGEIAPMLERIFSDESAAIIAQGEGQPALQV